jgi:hypothetical protein
MQHLNYQCKDSNDEVLATYNSDKCYASLEMVEYMLFQGAYEIIVRLIGRVSKIVDGIQTMANSIFIFRQEYLFHNALLLNYVKVFTTARKKDNL